MKDNYHKYLKYKNKYLHKINQIGGGIFKYPIIYPPIPMARIQMIPNYIVNIEINNILDDFNNKINNLNLKKCNKQDECIVCYNTDNMYFTRCNNHSICMNCSLKLYEQPCPMCRQ
jgi:hypothetical protein